MSAIGPKQTFQLRHLMSAFGSKADMEVHGFYFCLPKTDISECSKRRKK